MPVEASDIQRIKSIIESLMIVAAEPILADEIHKTLSESYEITLKEIVQIIEELSAQYKAEGRGFQISEIAEKYQLCTDPQNAEWVKNFLQVKNSERLSKPALETLAIIAYRQPITKLEVEVIRGVNVDGVLKKLTEKGLIRTKGKKDILGHPFMFVTTEKFLEYFGLKSLEELPRKEELKPLKEKAEKIEEAKPEQEEKQGEKEEGTAGEQPSPEVAAEN
jgi:segregation and condensation protein B